MSLSLLNFPQKKRELFYRTGGTLIILALICLGLQGAAKYLYLHPETWIPVDRAKFAAEYLDASDNIHLTLQEQSVVISPQVSTQPVTITIPLKTYPITVLSEDKIEGATLQFYVNFKNPPRFHTPDQKLSVYLNNVFIRQIPFNRPSKAEQSTLFLPAGEFTYTEMSAIQKTGLLRPLDPHFVAFPLTPEQVNLLAGIDQVTLELSSADFEGTINSISILLLYPVSLGSRFSLLSVILITTLVIAVVVANLVFLDMKFLRPLTASSWQAKIWYLYFVIVLILTAVTQDNFDLDVWKRIGQYYFYLSDNPFLLWASNPAWLYVAIFFTAPFVLLKALIPNGSDLLFVFCLKLPIFLSYLWTAYLLERLFAKLDVPTKYSRLGIVLFVGNPIVLYQLFWGQRDLVTGALIVGAIYAFVSNRDYTAFFLGALAFLVKEYALAFILAFTIVVLLQSDPPLWKRLGKLGLLGLGLGLVTVLLQVLFSPVDAIASNIRFRSGFGTFSGVTYLTFLYKQGLFDTFPASFRSLYFPVGFSFLGGLSLLALSLWGVLRERTGVILGTVCLLFVFYLTYPRINPQFLVAALPVLILLAAISQVSFWYVNLYSTLALFELFTFFGLSPYFWLSRTLAPGHAAQGLWGVLRTGQHLELGFSFILSLAMLFFILSVLVNQVQWFKWSRIEKKHLPLFIFGLSLLFLTGGVNKDMAKWEIFWDLSLMGGVPAFLGWYTNRQLVPLTPGSAQTQQFSSYLFTTFALMNAGYYFYLTTTDSFSPWVQTLFSITSLAALYLLLLVWRTDCSTVNAAFWGSLYSCFFIIATVFKQPITAPITTVSYLMLLINLLWFCLILGYLALSDVRRANHRTLLRRLKWHQMLK